MLRLQLRKQSFYCEFFCLCLRLRAFIPIYGFVFAGAILLLDAALSILLISDPDGESNLGKSDFSCSNY